MGQIAGSGAALTGVGIIEQPVVWAGRRVAGETGTVAQAEVQAMATGQGRRMAHVVDEPARAVALLLHTAGVWLQMQDKARGRDVRYYGQRAEALLDAADTLNSGEMGPSACALGQAIHLLLENVRARPQSCNPGRALLLRGLVRAIERGEW